MLGGGFADAQQPAIKKTPADTVAPVLIDRSATVAGTPASAGAVPAEKNELKYNLNTTGSHFVKVTLLNQTWLRLNQSNPGTTVIQEPRSSTFDIGLRRTRIQLFGQLNDHLFLYFQFGQNNFNFLNGFPAYNDNGTVSNRKIAAFFHDAVGEYLVFKNRDYLKIGAGLTFVGGLSRFSTPSVSSIMSLDVPVFAQATVDQTDEFGRKLSVYARGQIGPVDYRIGMADPFPIQTNAAVPPTLGTNASFARKGHSKQFQGLFLYQFFDKETNQTPGYMTGTYLGKKKIVNLEAGFITQKRAMWQRGASATDTVYANLNLWSVASFLDMPLNRAKGTAINAYVGYFHTDYGANYLRFNGIMNPGSGTSQVVGSPALGGTQGNAFPMFGTGSVVYSQLGYLMRQDMLGDGKGTLMPYVQAQVASYQRVTQTLGVYTIGLNYLVNGHNGKITIDYQNRPFYETAGTQIAPAGRRGQFLLQYQLFI